MSNPPDTTRKTSEKCQGDWQGLGGAEVFVCTDSPLADWDQGLRMGPGWGEDLA